MKEVIIMLNITRFKRASLIPNILIPNNMCMYIMMAPEEKYLLFLEKKKLRPPVCSFLFLIAFMA
jgi:hypothetical protein